MVLLCHSEGTYKTVMSFSTPVVGCLLKEGLQWGVTATPGIPLVNALLQDQPSPAFQAGVVNALKQALSAEQTSSLPASNSLLSMRVIHFGMRSRSAN